jgi:ubiquinone/menaquinone biosynthesis C-methylase UbiE
VGFGPGIAIRAAARDATNGKVVGVDHSDEMVRQATRRNRKAVQEGRVELHRIEADALRSLGSTFDKVLAVNSLGMWPQPVDRLVDIRSIMSGSGVIAIVSQPRCPGATNEHTERAEREIRQQLEQAGFAGLRSQRLELDPPVVCVLAAV